MHIIIDVKALAKEKEEINTYLESIFLFTLEPNCEDGRNNAQPRVFLEDSRSQLNQNWLDLQTLNEVIFERIMLCDPSENLTIKGNYEAAEKEKIRYLLQCFLRLNNHKKDNLNELYEKCQEVIIQQTVFILQNDEVFPEDSNSANLYRLFFEYREKGRIFVNQQIHFIFSISF